tara:strand:+ start:576 stop:752 length:177 start_codon:yes stop_codon:yes gene_type:complete
MYRNKKKMKKSIKTNTFDHDIVPASQKEKLPQPKDIFVMNKSTEKDKKNVKKSTKKRK